MTGYLYTMQKNLWKHTRIIYSYTCCGNVALAKQRPEPSVLWETCFMSLFLTGPVCWGVALSCESVNPQRLLCPHATKSSVKSDATVIECVSSSLRPGVWNHERTRNQRPAPPKPHHPAEEWHLLQPQDEDQQVGTHNETSSYRNIRADFLTFEFVCVFQAAGVLFAGCSGWREKPARVSGCFWSHRWDCNHLLK